MTDTNHIEVLRGIFSCGDWSDDEIAAYRAAIRALSPAGGDWVMAPREPTSEMLDAGAAEADDTREIYRAMIAAAPQPQEAPAKTRPVSEWIAELRQDPDWAARLDAAIEKRGPRPTPPAHGDGEGATINSQSVDSKSIADPSGQTLAGAGGALDAIYTDFCAKDNGDVPLERYPQGAVDALARAGWAVVPCDLPFAVLGDAAQAGVFETGNPKHGWDYLVARTRIGPNVTATSAGTTGDDSEDAARYRWIRDNSNTVNEHIQRMWAECKTAYPTPEEWDAAIDAARRVREVG